MFDRILNTSLETNALYVQDITIKEDMEKY